jgi:hypothetical protein
MANGRRRDLELEAYWRRMVSRQHRSGLSVRAFCAREGVPASAHWAWQRIIEQRDKQQQHVQAPAFLPVVVADADSRGAGGQITIELGGGRMMRLAADLPVAQLAAVLRAVEEAG